MLQALTLTLMLMFSTLAYAGNQCGNASWYGPGFEGNKTANGEIFSSSKMTAAHRTLPFGTKVKVKRKSKTVTVRINDRGPFVKGRIIDLSKEAASRLGLISKGVGHVCLTY